MNVDQFPLLNGIRHYDSTSSISYDMLLITNTDTLLFSQLISDRINFMRIRYSCSAVQMSWREVLENTAAQKVVYCVHVGKIFTC